MLLITKFSLCISAHRLQCFSPRQCTFFIARPCLIINPNTNRNDLSCRSYKRNRDMVLYSIYKNTVLSMGDVLLSLFSAYSAQSLYPEFFTLTYNLLWTSLPTFICAILDKDVNARTSENNPQLYAETQQEKTHKFIRNLIGWVLVGLWHSIVAFGIPCLTIISPRQVFYFLLILCLLVVITYT